MKFDLWVVVVIAIAIWYFTQDATARRFNAAAGGSTSSGTSFAPASVAAQGAATGLMSPAPFSGGDPFNPFAVPGCPGTGNFC